MRARQQWAAPGSKNFRRRKNGKVHRRNRQPRSRVRSRRERGTDPERGVTSSASFGLNPTSAAEHHSRSRSNVESRASVAEERLKTEPHRQFSVLPECHPWLWRRYWLTAEHLSPGRGPCLHPAFSPRGSLQPARPHCWSKQAHSVRKVEALRPPLLQGHLNYWRARLFWRLADEPQASQFGSLILAPPVHPPHGAR